MTFSDLAKEIQELEGKHSQKIVVIDGGGGAGKSTFARHLQKEIPGSEVVHGDDFYLGPWDRHLEHTDYDVNPLGDYDRFATEILDRVNRGEEVRYHVFNWHTNAIEDMPVLIPRGAIIIVEGLYLAQERFRDAYDFFIWIETDVSKRLERAIIRDGEHMRIWWEGDWLPVEKNYCERQQPKKYADIVVDGLNSDYNTGSFLLTPNDELSS